MFKTCHEALEKSFANKTFSVRFNWFDKCGEEIYILWLLEANFLAQKFRRFNWIEFQKHEKFRFLEQAFAIRWIFKLKLWTLFKNSTDLANTPAVRSF